MSSACALWSHSDILLWGNSLTCPVQGGSLNLLVVGSVTELLQPLLEDLPVFITSSAGVNPVCVCVCSMQQDFLLLGEGSEE